MSLKKVVTDVECWRKRIPDLGNVTVKLRTQNAVGQTERVSRLALDDFNERRKSRECTRECK